MGITNTATSRHRESKNVSDAERVGSVIAGGALIAYGLGKRSWAGLGLAVLGGAFVRRAASGHCDLYRAIGVNTARKRKGRNASVRYELGIRVDRTVTINKPVEEVYEYWRNLENLPRFMRHLESVREIDNKHSHWVAKGPAGHTVQWKAEIINEIPNQLIGWRSLPGADVDNAGSVHFKTAYNGRGTELVVELQYNPPGGTLGALFAKAFGEEPSTQIAEDLRRLKQLMETGEIATIDGQPSGRRGSGERKGKSGRKAKGWDRDAVGQASEESFPASDPPSWTPEALAH